MVWRIPEKFTILNEDNELSLKNCFYVNNLADLALIGVIKTIIKLNTNLQILYYRKNEKLNNRMASKQLTKTTRSSWGSGCIRAGPSRAAWAAGSKSTPATSVPTSTSPVHSSPAPNNTAVLINLCSNIRVAAHLRGNDGYPLAIHQTDLQVNRQCNAQREGPRTLHR